MFYIALKDAKEIKRLMIKLNLSNTLIALGSIPFVFLSILGLYSLDSFLVYNLEYLASLYTLIITCLICGTHWGIYLNNQKIKINLFFLSNILTLILFFSFLIIPNSKFILLTIFIFLILLLIDIYIFKNAVTDFNYIRVRFCITTLVIIALIILLFN